MAKRKKSSRKPVSMKQVGSTKSPTKILLWILAGVFGFIALSFLGFMMLTLMLIAVGDDIDLSGNVAVIEIKGPIMVDNGGGFGFDGTSSTDIVELIEEAQEADDISVIMFDINSPGGSAVASAEIATAIAGAEKPTVAVIREVGASGAFWSAMATDVVYAHPLSVTGSMGVISSYLEFSGFLDRYNVTYQRLVAGDMKDAGTPFKELTTNEEEKLQVLLDDIHEVFIANVAEHRNLDVEYVRDHADGFVFLGTKAKELGYVDHLGTQKDALRYIENTYNITADTVDYEKTPTIFEALGGVFSGNFYAMGQGIGDSFTQTRERSIPRI